MKTKNIAFSVLRLPFAVLLIALAIAGCKKDDPAPTLAADTETIAAANTVGTYSFNVTGNLAWTAAVTPAATWCTVAPDAGTGSGAVVLRLTANVATVTRAATVTIAAGALSRAVAVTQAAAYVINEVDNPPTHAASSYVWQFGTSTLTWSDAIHIPDCNKETFEISYDEPQCRSYTYEGKTFYYYNWPYVNLNANTLCPSPWRVPTGSDFDALITCTNAVALASAWGRGGYAYGSSMVDVGTYGTYWSSTETCISTAAYMHIKSSYRGMDLAYKNYGQVVRCVK
ncbi:MAG: hypothetical protein LBT61_01650 [Prevotellaceae bacterium]|jgi:hypothetical protein|nr:hypothetical protein [Prevotellaceae bacterium]